MHSRSRLASLDALRGIAALLVVIDHAAEPPFAPGLMGVFVFFCISGFVIPASLEGRTLSAFWWGRATRLFPAYWLALALTALLSRASWHIFLGNLTMTPYLFGTPSILRQAWTLQIELAFYVLACVIVRLKWRWDAVAPVLALLTLPFGIGYHETGILADLALCSTGAVIAQAWAGRLSWTRAWLVGVTVWVCLAGASSSTNQFPAWLVGLPIFGLGLAWKRWPASLVQIGRWSYSLYLFHNLCLALLGSLVGALASVPLAWLGYRLIERPALALSKRGTVRSERAVYAQETMNTL